MSNASIGIDQTVVRLIELNPLSVYRKLGQRVSRQREPLPLFAEEIRSYRQPVENVVDDCRVILEPGA